MHPQLRRVGADGLSGKDVTAAGARAAAKQQLRSDLAAGIARPGVSGQGRQLGRRLCCQRMAGVIGEGYIAQQGSPVELDQFGAVSLAGHRRRGRRRELAAVQAFEIKSQAALRTVESAWSAQLDVLKVGGLAAVQRFLEAVIGSQIHSSDAVLQKGFGVGRALVGVTRLVSVVDLRGNGKQRILRRGVYPQSKTLEHPMMG